MSKRKIKNYEHSAIARCIKSDTAEYNKCNKLITDIYNLIKIIKVGENVFNDNLRKLSLESIPYIKMRREIYAKRLKDLKKRQKESIQRSTFQK